MNEAEPERPWRGGEIIDGRYEVIELVGKGGMGWVYRVRHLQWGIDLVVKQPRTDVSLTPGAFAKEAEAWVGLGLHPNLCCCHYVRQLGGVPMAFAEYAPGGSLHDWITDSRRLYEGTAAEVQRRILDVAIQFAWGLEHAHQRGIVHQDVKPHNVLLDTSDGDISVKVTDFGLARARAGTGPASRDRGADADTAAGFLVSAEGGTPEYASPEQLSALNGRLVFLNQSTDVYSYAVSVLEMFTGKPPSRGDRAWHELSAHLAQGAAEPGVPQMPDALRTLLRSCLDEEPEDPRPESMAGIGAKIVAIYESEVHSPYPRTMPRAADLLADELNNRGLSLLDLRRDAEAEEAFTAALEADPRHLEATYNGGLRQWRSGAIADDVLISKLEAARTASGDSSLARYLLAEVHLERGDLTAARELLRTVEPMGPKEPNVARALRTVRSGRLTDARCVKTLTMNWWPEYERWVTEADGHRVKYASRTKIRFTADGRRALVSSMKHVGLWDVNSGRCLFRRDEPHYYKQIDISADGCFALWSLDNEVQMWDLARGHELWHAETRADPPSGTRYIGMSNSASAPVEILQLSADARIAAMQSGGGNVQIRDARTGGVRLRLGRHDKLYALSSDGLFALIRCDGDTMQLRDTTTGACRWELRGVNGAMPAAISPDGRTIAIARPRETGAGTRANIGIRDLTTGREIRALTGHASRVWSLSWGSDGQHLLSGASDGTVRLWQLDSGRCLRTFPSTSSFNQEVFLDPDAGYAVAADEDMVRWWTLPSHYTAPSQLSRPRRHGELTRLDADVAALIGAAEQAIAARRFTEAHELLTRARATPGYERAPHVLSAWRSLTDALPRAGVRASWQVGEFPGLSVSPCAVDLSLDGTRIVSGGETLRVWDTSTGRRVREWDTGTGPSAPAYRDHPSPITAVRISPDQQRVLSATQDGEICVWSIDTGDCLMKIAGQTGRLVDYMAGGAQPAHFSANGRWALVCSRNKALHLWDMNSAQCVRTVPGHGPNGFVTTDLWVSPDGRRAVSGSWDRSVRVWDLENGECMHILACDTEILSVSLSPDASCVLASGNDRTIRLWDLSSGDGVHVQRDLPSNAHDVRYVCEGRFAMATMAVVPGSATSVVQVLDRRTGRFLHSLDTRQLGLVASAFAPDGRFALTGGLGTPLRLWELDWEPDVSLP